eukprot:355021-Chlamydomonas_euryale.AAC.6
MCTSHKGKSVIAEAIAFALNGDKRMLRAKAMQAFVNEGSSRAVVTLTFSSTSAAATRLIKVERSLAQNARAAVTRVCFMDDTAMRLEPAWKVVSASQLHDLLMEFGINTDHTFRIIVTQSKQAVEVHDPLKLVSMWEGANESTASPHFATEVSGGPMKGNKFQIKDCLERTSHDFSILLASSPTLLQLSWIETMMGTSELAERIKEADQQIKEVLEQTIAADEECERLSSRRESLAPEVAKSNQCQELHNKVLAQRRSLLQSKHDLTRVAVSKSEERLVGLEKQQQKLQSSFAALAAEVDSKKCMGEMLLSQLQDLEDKKCKARKELESTVLAAARAEARAKSSLASEAQAVKQARRQVSHLTKRLSSACNDERDKAECLDQIQTEIRELQSAFDCLDKNDEILRIEKQVTCAHAEAVSSMSRCQQHHNELVHRAQSVSQQMRIAEQNDIEQREVLAEGEAEHCQKRESACSVEAEVRSMASMINDQRDESEKLRDQYVEALVGHLGAHTMLCIALCWPALRFDDMLCVATQTRMSG